MNNNVTMRRCFVDMGTCVICGSPTEKKCEFCGGAVCTEHTNYYRGRPYCDKCWDELYRIGIMSWLPPIDGVRKIATTTEPELVS